MTQTLFEAQSIDKKYPKRKGDFFLSDISLKLNAGEITGVVGENGNGKTTLLRIIAGELSHTEGELKYPDINLSKLDWLPIKEKIAYIPQRIPRWFGVLKDNLHFTASVNGIKGKENEQKVDQILNQLDLTAYAEHKWSEISTGYRLRFQLAKMLIGDPQLLILDEPIANLDINAQQKFLSDLRVFVEESKTGLSVILSSQQLHEIESVSDNIVFLKKGKCLYAGAVNNFGIERTENTFEIECSLSEEEISLLFSPNELITIEKQATQFVIEVDLSIDGQELLKRLIEAGATINYFRNISQSTRKLFNPTAIN